MSEEGRVGASVLGGVELCRLAIFRWTGGHGVGLALAAGTVTRGRRLFAFVGGKQYRGKYRVTCFRGM